MKAPAASPAGQALDHFLREQFDVLQYIRDHMPAIEAVAGHLTPVEDLRDFQDQIETLYPRLGLLVEASDLLVSASAAGITLLQAIDVPAQRAALGLGSAALRSEGFFASSQEHQALTLALNNLDLVVTQLLVDLGQAATQGELTALANRVAALESSSGFNARLNQLIKDLEDGTFFTVLNQRIDGLSLTISQQTTLLNAQVARIDAILLDVDNLTTGLAAQGALTNALTSRVTSNEQGITVLTQAELALRARVSNNENEILANGSAVNQLSVQVASIGNQQSATSTALTTLTGRVTTAEGDLAAQGEAHRELSVRVVATENGLESVAQDVTSLYSSLSSVGNLLPNSDFEVDVRGWELFSLGDGWEAAELDRVSLPELPLPLETRALRLHTPAIAAPTAGAGARSSRIPVGQSQRMIISAYLGALNCKARLDWRLLDAAGAEIGFGTVHQTTSDVHPTLGAWPRKHVVVPVAVGAATLQLQLWATDCTGGTPRAVLLRPMVEEAVPGQTQPSPWTPGTGGLELAMSSALQTLRTRVISNEGLITALSEGRTELFSRMDLFESALVQEIVTSANKNGAMAAANNALHARLLTAEGDIAGEASARSQLTVRVQEVEGTVSAQAESLDTLTTTVGENTAAIQTQKLVVDGLKASYQVKLDVNGHVIGFGLYNEAGTGSFLVRADKFAISMPGENPVVPFSVDATGVYMENAFIRNLSVNKITGGNIGSQWNLNNTSGRIVLDTGAYMKVIGVGFGANADLIEWFGPKMDITACTKANAKTYVGMDGSAYFGGSLSAGTLYNAAETTSSGFPVSAVIGPFSTNGNAKTVVTSYAYSHSNPFNSASIGNGPGGTVTVKLFRTIGTGSETLIATYNVQLERFSEQDGADWQVSEWGSGSWTYTDTSTGTDDRTFRVEVTSRTGTANIPTIPTQRAGAVITEQ